MSIRNQIIVISICFLLSFVFMRGFLYGIKRYQLNKSAYKKRKQSETLKESLLYSKYKEEIPKILIILYYLVLIIHIAGLIICILFYIIEILFNIGELVVRIIVWFDIIWMIIIAVLFWSPGKEFAYKRWIVKNRGQNRNQK